MRRLSPRIRGALRRGEFVLHYQPQVDCATGETTAVEALARWQPRDGALRPPADFLCEVEESPCFDEFTARVLNQAIGQASRWREGGLTMQVAVNLSVRCLRMRLVETLAALLERHRLPASLLQLEITEGPVGPGKAQPAGLAGGRAAVLERVRAMGVSIALDDFGTAQSNLARLVAFPIDTLKIDRSFVFSMFDDPISEEVVRSAIDLGRRAGLLTVAEGVETGAHMRRVSELGADAAQGFWLGKPMPPEVLADWLRRRRGRRAPAPVGAAIPPAMRRSRPGGARQRRIEADRPSRHVPRGSAPRADLSRTL